MNIKCHENHTQLSAHALNLYPLYTLRLVLKVAGCASNDKDQSKGDGDSEDSVA